MATPPSIVPAFEISGLGPLDCLLEDSSISDILVCAPKLIYVERNGKLELTTHEFDDDDHLIAVIKKIVSTVGRSIDEASPMVDARLPDGSRVNAAIAPVTLDGPALSIRRFSKMPLTPQALVDNGSMTQGMLELLKAGTAVRLNTLISGGTGSGKTTLLNALTSFISEDERIVTIEDAAELRLQQKHVIRMEARPPSAGGHPAIPIRQLVVNALRMRPDRIIVGEVRSDETLDMLQAMNTGHDGSLTTIHANNPRDALSRMETMIGMASENMNLRSVRHQISSAIDLIVHIARFSDGSRKITRITECLGMEGDIITQQDLFVFEKTGVNAAGKVTGKFRATGVRPKFSERVVAAGLELPQSLFTAVVEVK